METFVGGLIPKMYNNNKSGDSKNNKHALEGGRNFKDDTKLIIDLDYVIEKFIMYMNESRDSKERIKNFDDVDIIINWKRVEIYQDDAKFDLSFNEKLPKIPVSQTLFRTSFTNTTECEQEYSFKTERKTSQTCSFTYTQGFTKSKDGSVTFKLPQEILEIGGGLSYEKSTEYGKDETKSDEITWGVDSIVKVAPHTRAFAELVIDEQQLSTDFSIDFKMTGRVSITINKRGTNNFIMGTTADIYQIIELVMAKKLLPNLSSVFEIITINDKKYAKATMKGKCDFRLAVSQQVTLRQQKL